MKVTDLELEGLKLIELDVFKDSRGLFSERFNSARFQEAGIDCDCQQINHSRSIPGVVRGLHFQLTPLPQGKLVGTIRGRIWDVAVDIRPGSKTFGRHLGVELSEENGRVLWIPPGFAHGFCVLGQEISDVLYAVSATYNPKTEKAIRWNDPDLGIKWPVTNPVLSEKDHKNPTFSDYCKTLENHTK
jgi:dTDP-4-dehydrorhamnose 3,5-epimerase